MMHFSVENFLSCFVNTSTYGSVVVEQEVMKTADFVLEHLLPFAIELKVLPNVIIEYVTFYAFLYVSVYLI